jgi:hypothetical protein
MKFGGATPRPTAAYDVSEGAKTYDDWRKAVGAESWVREGAKMLREALNCSARAILPPQAMGWRDAAAVL